MKYGYFDDNRSEYVITSPETPTPWINYLGCEQFFSLFSQTGGGYCFYRDARLRRITRYRYNNIPLDANGRYFYIRDEADGDYWSVGYMPVKRPVDQYECRHGLGYSKISSRRNQITSSLLAFVPLGSNCEVMQITYRKPVENDSEAEAVFVRRVLPVECPRRHDQLPKEPEHRRSGSRGSNDLSRY